MSDTLDLTGDIALAVNGAALRGTTLALAYVRENGSPSVSFRGSTQVHSQGELALWARKRDSGLAPEDIAPENDEMARAAVRGEATGPYVNVASGGPISTI